MPISKALVKYNYSRKFRQYLRARSEDKYSISFSTPCPATQSLALPEYTEKGHTVAYKPVGYGCMIYIIIFKTFKRNMADSTFNFVGGSSGLWRVVKMETITGEPLESISGIDVRPASEPLSSNYTWILKGVVSNLRYTEKQEKESLVSIQENLGRAHATCAALISMRKSELWWNLAQDERRAIFEKQSQHTKTGLKYLPAIARKLFHSRDIGEPFDFLTWFEYAPEHSNTFEELVKRLRDTEEWTYVDREIDIRLVK